MRTLYEDWQLRRARMTACEPSPHFCDQTRVFDYLLVHYKDNPHAYERARFPFQSDLSIDTRAILIHHHMAVRELGGPRNVAEAHDRARGILAHISKVNPQASIAAPTLHAALSDDIPAEDDLARKSPPLPVVTVREDWWLTRLWRRLWRFFIGESRVENRNTVKIAVGMLPRALAQKNAAWVESLCYWAISEWPEAFRPALREDLVDALFEYAQYSDFQHNRMRCDAALGVLERCRNVGVLHAYVRSFVHNIGSDPFRARLRDCVLRERARCADFVRMQLACDNPLARARAAQLLSEIGDLHDIGMFHDLLTLPAVQMETEERDAYLLSMRVLSGLR